MDAVSQFQGVPLTRQRNFSWIFLVTWILTVILSLSFIFYLGRTIAYIITFILEWLLWKHAKVKVNIQSLRISLLGGRIFFKNVTIIHKDSTISILEGNITWRYWLFNTRKPEFQEASVDETQTKPTSIKNWQLPCRFVVNLEGLEIFLYNKTVAYDNIIQMFSKEERFQFEKFLNEQILSDSATVKSMDDSQFDTSESTSTDKSESSATNDRVFQEEETDTSSFLRFLPIQFLVTRGSLILGNKFTPSLLIVSADSADALMDFAQPKEKLDLYKFKLSAELINTEATLKQNIGFDEDVSMKFKLDRGKVSEVWNHFTRMLGILYKPLRFTHMHRRKNEHEDKFQAKWRGLALYKGTGLGERRNDIDDIEFDFANHEYAKFSSILKSPKVTFTSQHDMPGIVPHGAHPTISVLDGPDVGNSGAPPDYSLDIQIFGGSVCFGPWAQRQADHLWKLLSPVVSRTAKPVKRLTPGCRRIYTYGQVLVTIMDDATWRIPTRESSKDFEFLQHYRETNEEYRPFGWIDLKFSKETTVNTTFALCPTVDGFKNNIKIHLTENETRSSVNHDILLKCKYFDFDIDTSFPLGWNDEATWTINLNSSQMEAFILREHITLIADTLTDFSSGEPTPYELFRPFIYSINWKIDGYSLYLNVNDHNIVNNPLDFNENCYLSFHGDELSLDFLIPKTSITARHTDISYTIKTPMFRLLLNTPPWNTLNEFMKHKEVGRSYDFKVVGSYLIYSDLDIDNVDTIMMDCTSKGTTLQCYGFVVRYLINVKMNYFGDFFHFVTSEEYTGAIRANEDDMQYASESDDDRSSISSFDTMQGNDAPGRRRLHTELQRSDLKRTTNETDLWFTFTVWEGALLLPETIYNCDPCVGLHFGELVIDLRSCNYYMDLLANMNDVSIKRYVSKHPHEIFEAIHKNNGEEYHTHGSLSSLTIHGHRMYGLPPMEPTYFCQWDFDLGTLDIASDIEFLRGFFSSFTRIGFGYVDLENILLYEKETYDDMTSVTVNLEKLSVMLQEPKLNMYASFDLNNLYFTFIDFENEKYSTRLDLIIPTLEFSLFIKEEDGTTKKLFTLETKVKITNFVQSQDFDEHRKTQREYIKLHDAPYHRCSFILPQEYQDAEQYQELFGAIAPSSSLPPLPVPLIPSTTDFIIEDLLGEFQDLLETSSPFRMPFSDQDYATDVSDDETEEDIDPLEFNTPSEAIQNDKCERDSFIIDVSFISIEICPDILDSIGTFLMLFSTENIVQIIDDIEIATVNRLSNLREGAFKLTNVKINILYLDLFWGSRTDTGVGIYLDRIDFAMCEKTVEENKEKKLIELTVLNKIRSVRGTVNQTAANSKNEERPPALSLVIEGWEIWSSTVEDQVNSLNILSTDITVDEAQLEWLFGYFDNQGLQIQDMIKTSDTIQKRKIESRKELISSLTAASEYYQISHDPYVITKPAFITRLSRGHVRENRSWKIITRLRHILTYLPEDWHSTINRSLTQSKTAATTQDAKGIFISVFSNWRNWEFSDIARSYIYRKLFLNQHSNQEIHTTKKSITIKIASFFVTVYSAGYEVEHNFIITRTNLLLETNSPTSDSSLSRETIFNITGTLGTAKGKLSDKIIMIKNLLPSLKITDGGKSKETFDFVKSFKLNTLILCERGELQIDIGNTRLVSRVFGARLSMLWESPKDLTSQAVSLAVYTQRAEIHLKHINATLAEIQIRDFSLIVTTESWSYKPTILVNSQCSDLHLMAMTATDILVASIKEIMENIHRIEQDLLAGTRAEKITKVESHGPKPKVNTILTCFFTNISFELMPISPFFIRHEAKQLDIYFNRFGSNEILLSVWDADIYLTSHLTKQQYFRFSFGDLQLKGNMVNDPYHINLYLSASILKLTVSDVQKLIPSFLQDEKILTESIEDFITLDLFGLSKNQKSKPEKDNNKFSWSIDTNINYFGLLAPIGSAYFLFELRMLLASLTKMGSDIPNQSDISGQFSVENVLFFIKERALPVRLSKLLDFSIKVSALQKKKNTSNTYQIESSHFRVCLSPESLVRLLWATNQVSTSIQYYKDHHVDNKWDLRSKLNNIPKAPDLPLNVPSFHILSYNFCVGWLFSVDSKSEPGLILGYNRLFSAYEKNLGKLTLVDVFFSIANGNSSDNFFSEGKEKDKYNRSYLPNMQISYWFKDAGTMRDLFVRFHGEALDVTFLSSYLDVIESALTSVQTFQELKKDLIPGLPKKQKVNDDKTLELNTLSPFLANIRSISCQFKYDGGVFKIFSLEDAETQSEPSFEVNSPNVVIDLNYKHLENRTKQHWIRSLIKINSTHNILYAKCAPLLSDFFERIQGMVKKHSSSEESTLSKPSSQNLDYKRLLDSFDIALKITSAKQQLSLSCEPKAKVQADIGFQSFIFTVTTNDLDAAEPLSFSLSVEKTEASIKHIFSRETSTSIGVDFVDVTLMFTHPDVINVHGTALISNINLFFNVKQLQNLYLFLDIWRLSDLLKSKPANDIVKAKTDSSLSIAQLSDPESIIPWCFTLIFTNVKGDVDLGPSLGVISVQLKRTWFATDHYKNMRKVLHAFTDGTSLSSKGRLSGIFELKGASWISEVNWPTDTTINAHPLVSITMNIDEISTKAAFDYHMFLIGAINNTRVHLHSEKDVNGVMPDLLKVTFLCESITLCSTALVAANILDIYNTAMRMRQDNKISYIETLRESNEAESKPPINYTDILRSLNLLQTDVSVDIYTLNIQISPITLFDVEVLVITIESISARSETHSGKKLMTELEMQVYDASVSLSTSKEEMDEATVSKISVKNYLQYASKIVGGTIIEIPKLLVSMTTFQEEKSDILEYLYTCVFDDKLSVRWNLGPINFIKEMWTTHIRAIAVRRSQVVGVLDGQSEEDVEKRIKEEENFSRFKYVALEPPRIDMPQIRDLGDATPPMEWFGVNRKRFPAFTHQTAVFLVQKLVYSAEREYANILGSS